MYDTEYAVEPSQVNSIVLGAAEKEASRLGFKIAPPALDLLLTRSLKTLNDANERGALEAIRSEVEHNTAQLIQYIVREQVDVRQANREITYQQMILGLSAFCELFPDFAPFCTK